MDVAAMIAEFAAAENLFVTVVAAVVVLALWEVTAIGVAIMVVVESSEWVAAAIVHEIERVADTALFVAMHHADIEVAFAEIVFVGYWHIGI